MAERVEGTPEQRTAAFFGQEVFALEKGLKGREIVVAEIGVSMTIVETQPYPTKRVGDRYKAMQSMSPGDVYVFSLKMGARSTTQTLVVASDQDGIGACVRILSATAEGARLATETAISRHLGVNSQDSYRLSFKDDTERLYLEKVENGKARADEVFGGFFES